MNLRFDRLYLLMIALLMQPNSSWAQIIYEPAASGTSIPTLSVSMLIFLVALLSVATKWFGFKRGSGAGKTIGMLVVCAIASGALSIKLIPDVYADYSSKGQGGTTLGFIDSSTGGSVPINEDSLNIFENTSGTPQRIVDVIVSTCPNTNSGLIDGVVQCSKNSVVSTGEDGLCYTDCRPPI